MHALRHAEVIQRAGIGGAKLLVGHVDGRRDLVLIEHHHLVRELLRLGKAGFRRFVILPHFLVGGLHLIAKLGRRKRDVLNPQLFVFLAEFVLDLLGRDHHAAQNGALQFAENHLIPGLIHYVLERDSLLGQGRLELVLGCQRPIGKELRKVGHQARQGFVVGGGNAQPVGFIERRALRNHLIDELRQIDLHQLRRDLPLAVILELLLRLQRGDLLAADFRQHRIVGGGGPGVVVGDQVGDHGQRHQGQQSPQDVLLNLVRASEQIKHGDVSRCWRAAVCAHETA